MLLTRKSTTTSAAQARLARSLSGMLARTVDRRAFLKRSGLAVGAGAFASQLDAVSLFFAAQAGGDITSSSGPMETSSSAMQKRLPENKSVDCRNSTQSYPSSGMVCEPPPASAPAPPRVRGGKRYDEWRCLWKTESPAWDKAIADLAAEIKLRHLARNTLKAYANWSQKFQNYLKNKPPNTLSPVEVKAYLTYLAVDCKVSSSHQNQAFNALLFLYRHVLKRVAS